MIEIVHVLILHRGMLETEGKKREVMRNVNMLMKKTLFPSNLPR